ncbi:hypothetical protein ACFW6F_22035 [Streptomyces sp. NPDC058746]|uniref:hypothetical protein n=1 Tax=Streptomyces sp. NPDC058746 TaxID=3346622 RepID=UPI0036CDEB94
MADEAAATFYTGRAYAGPSLGLAAQGECVNLPTPFADRIESVEVAPGVAVEVFRGRQQGRRGGAADHDDAREAQQLLRVGELLLGGEQLRV